MRLPRPPTRRSLLTGVLAGGLYGLSARLLAHDLGGAAIVMTFSFILVVPLVMGVIAVWRTEALTAWKRALLPWGSVLIAVAVSALLSLEGAICLIMALPVMLAGATIGGFAEQLVRRFLRGRTASGFALVAVLALPWVSGSLERRETPAIDVRRVDSRIEVAASPAAIWDRIASVAEVRPEERHASPIHWIGFPHPLAATLSRPGVGGVRRATFERGLTFIETITEWRPQRALAFAFHANTDSIPRTTLDAHVTVGGEFFDVLEGRYEIVPLAPGRCELRLSSRHRLSTRINPYAALWSDFVMGEIQRTILAVIRDRCEAAPAGSRARGGTPEQ